MNLPFPDPALSAFHPAIQRWFQHSFPATTPAQAAAWPLIRARRSTLVAAPTGSGKTLTAFLAVLDELVCQALTPEGLPEQVLVVYVSPLKALSNDIQLNLQGPLAGISQQLESMGLPALPLRTAVRTGDTPQKDRAAMRRRPPHILVTTPESLYVLLGSDGGRQMLSGVHTVIVDEIHAVAGSKRGSHLALSLERLQALSGAPLRRIGLSATQTPIERVAGFLAGHQQPCEIVDIGHARPRDLALEVPPVPLEAVMANDVWVLLYDRVAALAKEHRTTLVFVNTRRLAERLALHLSERLGHEQVAAHHGSLARDQRLSAEQRLKRGELRVLVATASLELGIDIGEVDLVCQISSPRSIAAFLQRVGRSGHQVGGTPKGRLFATSRDDLIECVALLDCVRRGELDELKVPQAPLDVLAQHIVAEVSCREWDEAALLALFRCATPYAELAQPDYQAVVTTLAEGYETRQGLRSAYLHRDTVGGTLRGRRGSKLAAVTSGGTIADNADYAVMLEPQGLNIGSVNEDFAVESLAGDVFQLGNASYRIIRVEGGRVRVEDAKGMPPNVPFWLGEAPGRSDELSRSVARLQAAVDEQLARSEGQHAPVRAWMTKALALDLASAEQLLEYLARIRHVLGALPSQDTLIMERFLDASGGTQLVVHSPFGSRVNRAWGLALRKRFGQTFNIELQAAASEDAIVVSLPTEHRFTLDDVWGYLRSATAEAVLVQAVLEAPLFRVRWRWNAANALALPRFAGGRKVAPQLQRMKSEDLITHVFPEQAACMENAVGEREVPDHPLVRQTLHDCLHEALDSDRWLQLLRCMEAGEVRLISHDLPSPSPLAAAILNARPYAFLDNAPLEERRTLAVLGRRWTDPESADDLGALAPEAIEAVRLQAWPQPRSTDEMHEALMNLGVVTQAEAQAHAGWPDWLAALAKTGRAGQLITAGNQCLWFARERLLCVQAAYPGSLVQPALAVLPGFIQSWDIDAARRELIRSRLGGLGPQQAMDIAQSLGLAAEVVVQALAHLQAEGYLLQGRFQPGLETPQWCERHLLARIHRYTVKRLRKDIEPVSLQDFTRFLFDWQHVSPATRLEGQAALTQALAQLEGYNAPAGAWENDLLPARVKGYSSTWLDAACRSGKTLWLRRGGGMKSSGTALRTMPIMLLPRAHLGLWQALANHPSDTDVSPRAQKVVDALSQQGALFFDQLQDQARLLRTELENALAELVANGHVSADSFAGLRALVTPASSRQQRSSRRGLGAFIGGMQDAGRWALLSPPANPPASSEQLEHLAMTLLRRYGVVFWRLLECEADWLPSWRDLLRTFQRLEARGEIRGGRFIEGLAGEHFALPEAIPLLREVRRKPLDGSVIGVSAIDPLNLSGTLLPGTRVPSLAANRLVYLDGVPAAAMIGGKPVHWLEQTAAIREALIRRP